MNVGFIGWRSEGKAAVESGMLKRARPATPRRLAVLVFVVLVAVVGPSRGAAATLPLPSGPLGGAPLALLAVQQAELSAADAAAGADFGWSVALSGDTALVGADGRTLLMASMAGAAYIFTRSGTVWSLQQELLNPDADSTGTFGSAVALSGDTALVGADGATVGGQGRVGAAYIFTRSGTSWSLQTELADPRAAGGDAFGSAVALSGDTALVGADGVSFDGKTESGVGAAYIFTRSGTSWSQQAELADSDAAGGDDFGWSVALLADTALVGAPFNTVSGDSGAGAAYVFSRSGTSWSQQAALGASDENASDGFGASLALSGDAALVCADGRTTTSGARNQAGACYVFTRSGTSWSPQAELSGSDEKADDDFGWSVALSGDTALVGAYGKDVGVHSRAGAAYVFTRSGTSWLQRAEMTDPDAAADKPLVHDNLGSSVALSGTSALVGADGVTVYGQRYAGAACVYALDPVPRLSLTASARALKVGRRISLSGAVKHFVASARTVVIERKVGHKLTRLKRVAISRSGAFRWTAKMTEPGTWVLVACYRFGATTYTSNAAKVTVRK